MITIKYVLGPVSWLPHLLQTRLLYNVTDPEVFESLVFIQVIISGSNTAYAGLTTGEKVEGCSFADFGSCTDFGFPGDILFWDREGGGILHRLQVIQDSCHKYTKSYGNTVCRKYEKYSG